MHVSICGGGYMHPPAAGNDTPVLCKVTNIEDFCRCPSMCPM